MTTTSRAATRASTSQPSRLAMPAMLLAVFVVPLSIAGTAVTLPHVAATLGSSPVGLQWVINGFNAAFAAFTLVWGSLADRIGHKQVFLLGVIVNVLASLGSALAPTLTILDISRLVAGASAAAIATAAPAIVAAVYTGAAKARNFALLGTTLGVGLAVGPSIAGGITAAAGWRGVFVVSAVVVALSVALAGFIPRVAASPHPQRRLIEIGLLRDPRFMSVVLVPMVQAFGFIALLTYLPIALSAVYGLSAGTTGLVMLAMTGPVLVAPLVGARLVQTRPRVTLHTLATVSILLMLVGNAGMILLVAHAPVWALIVPMILLGISFGLPLGIIDGAAQENAPRHLSGAAAGLLNFLRLGTEALVVGLYAASTAGVIGLHAAPGLAHRIASGTPGHATIYADAFLVGQIGILVAVIVGLAVSSNLRRRVNRSVMGADKASG
ncbi:MFS transporter [Frondihabitans australicus]|uniref:Putative MFS family arabinose efflux permease n=1 Tax=Frondihabitans australicus TaxID=386892 RepID=A0A495IH66_9MICO|nr:MFS transporter [Frondihabitans australicus]RKR74788.1 putative MFS family arabinose efflux permease [Frondihabitans australicus]